MQLCPALTQFRSRSPLWENKQERSTKYGYHDHDGFDVDDNDGDLMMMVIKFARQSQLIHGKMMLTRTFCTKNINNSFPFVVTFFRRAKMLPKVFTFLTCLPFADRWLIRGQSSAAKTFRRSRLDEDELTASRELTTPVHSYSQRGFIGQKIPRFLQKSSSYFV